GIKPNVQAIMRDVMDILGYRNRNDWFVPMNQQEIQQANQPNNIQIIKEMMKGQREKERSQDKSQMMESQQIMDIVKIVMKELMGGAVKGEAMPSITLGRALDAIGAQNAFTANQEPPQQ